MDSSHGRSGHQGVEGIRPAIVALADGLLLALAAIVIGLVVESIVRPYDAAKDDRLPDPIVLGIGRPGPAGERAIPAAGGNRRLRRRGGKRSFAPGLGELAKSYVVGTLTIEALPEHRRPRALPSTSC